MLKGLRNIIRRPKPLRAIAKTLLLRTAGLDLGKHGMNIRVYDDFLIGLHPTTLTLSHWLNRTARLSDYQFLRQYLRPGDVYIDIGANIGTTVIPAARAVGHGRVIAFEPQPQIFCYLKNNLALNGIVNVSLHDWALGPENGELSFSTDRLDDRNRISDGGNTCVQVRTLDEFAGDLPAVALVKIDVEGYEKLICAGGMRTLQNTACVYFELGEAGYKVYGYSGSDLFEYLRGLGFEVYRRCKDGVLERLDAAHGVPEGRHINAFAIRNMRDFLERTT